MSVFFLVSIEVMYLLVGEGGYSSTQKLRVMAVMKTAHEK
jgi:hypothetical protein